MSIDAGAQVAIILLACRPCVVIVNCLGHVLYLGRASRTKETLLDFHECRVGYSTSTSIPRVDGLSTDTPVLGCHGHGQSQEIQECVEVVYSGQDSRTSPTGYGLHGWDNPDHRERD